MPAGSPCTSSFLPVSLPFPHASIGRARLSSRYCSQAERTPGVLEEHPSQLVGCTSPVFQSLHHAWLSWSGWLCPVVRLVFNSGERAADATLGRQSWAISPNQLWPRKHELEGILNTGLATKDSVFLTPVWKSVPLENPKGKEHLLMFMEAFYYVLTWNLVNTCVLFCSSPYLSLSV